MPRLREPNDPDNRIDVFDVLRQLINNEAQLVAVHNFFEFSESDAQLISQLHEPLRQYTDQFGSSLHQYLSDVSTLSGANIASLLQRQSTYFSPGNGGWIDPTWVRNRILVRLNQYRVGLTPKWYFKAYQKFLLLVLPNIWACSDGKVHYFHASFYAIAKVIWFDLAVALEDFLKIDEYNILLPESEVKQSLEMPVATGKRYLQLMACELSRALGVRYAMVAQVRGPLFLMADALAMTDHGKPVPDFSYVLADSPCNTVLAQHHCMFPSGVQELFPADEGLKRLSVQSYAGVTLHAYQERPLGILVVMHDAPFTDIERVSQLLAAFSGRAAAEIERLQTQQTLMDNEAHFRAAINQAAVGICHTDKHGQFILVNIKMCQILGYKESELSDKKMDEITYPPDREKSRNLISQLLQKPESSLKLEQRYLRRDGVVIWAQATYSVTVNADGSVDSIMAVVEDISERKQLEYSLRLSNRALESSGNGVVISNANDPNNSIIFANSAFCRITGYSLEEVMGRNCRFMQNGDHEQIELKMIRTALAKNQEIHVVVRNYRKDGSMFWNDLSISPVPDEYGVVTHFIGIINDITKQRSNQDQLAFRATHDELTGLPNRNLLNDRLPQALRQANRRENLVALLFLDVDHFKLINDSIGHSAGDKLLKGFAERLIGCVRAGDTVSRHGGDEFVLVLKDIEKASHVVTICENIFQSIGEPFFIQNHKIHATCSIGITLYPQDGGDAETLSKFADMALYRAKDLGRANFQFFSKEMNQRTLERVTLEGALRSAIINDQLTMNYQPLVNLDTGRIISLEALLRWYHPELGQVAPDRFIPVAEESGLINPIGEWVLNRACQDLRAWLDLGLPAVRVAINISPKQFRDAHLGDKIEAALLAMRLPPQMLTLEITETVLMQDTASSEATLRQLKRLGISLALDDFGTGYSSLSYLKRFPFDRVKIDRAFVRDIANDADDAALCKTIIKMAHSLGIMVIAEGVESEDQCLFLRKNLCDEIQGYLFSRPLPAEQIERLLREPRFLAAHLFGRQTNMLCLLLVEANGSNNLLPIARSIVGEEGRLLMVHTGSEAHALLAQQVVDFVILDEHLPGIDATLLLQRIKTAHPDVKAFIVGN
jgi:diguanylate cyclase (GGDEF)-like protein/PAS domain S-box-containing protein